MGVVSRKWMWMESMCMGVVVRRYNYISSYYAYISLLLLYVFLFAAAPYSFFIFLLMFSFLFQYYFVIEFDVSIKYFFHAV